jgi:hypothetical protein
LKINIFHAKARIFIENQVPKLYVVIYFNPFSYNLANKILLVETQSTHDKVSIDVA